MTKGKKIGLGLAFALVAAGLVQHYAPQVNQLREDFAGRPMRAEGLGTLHLANVEGQPLRVVRAGQVQEVGSVGCLCEVRLDENGEAKLSEQGGWVGLTFSQGNESNTAVLNGGHIVSSLEFEETDKSKIPDTVLSAKEKALLDRVRVLSVLETGAKEAVGFQQFLDKDGALIKVVGSDPLDAAERLQAKGEAARGMCEETVEVYNREARARANRMNSWLGRAVKFVYGF